MARGGPQEGRCDLLEYEERSATEGAPPLREKRKYRDKDVRMLLWVLGWVA